MRYNKFMAFDKRKNLLNYIIYFIFLFLTSSMMLFSREFAHMNIKVLGFPVYVTEIAILIISILMVFNYFINKDKKIITGYKLKFEHILIFLILIVSLVTGLVRYGNVYVFRHSALFYYSIFSFLVPAFLTDMRQFEIFVIVSAFLIFINSIIYMIFSNNIFNNFNYYYQGLFIFIIINSLIMIKNKIINIAAVLTAVIFIYEMIDTKVRAAWVALIIATILNIALLIIFRKKLDMKKSFIIKVSVTVMLAILLIVCLSFFNLNNYIGEFKSIYSQSDEASPSYNNAVWRLIVWKDIIKKSMQKPILGYGFGMLYNNDTLKDMGWAYGADTGFLDPHNSYLSILYRTGILGISIFLLFIVSFFVKAINFLRKFQDRQTSIYMIGILSSVVFILVISFFMVVLEGPYLGIFLWIFIGLALALINIESSRLPSDHGI